MQGSTNQKPLFISRDFVVLPGKSFKRLLSQAGYFQEGLLNFQEGLLSQVGYSQEGLLSQNGYFQEGLLSQAGYFQERLLSQAGYF